MGEIDTKPIESVQTALSFFGQQRNSPTKDEHEIDKERDTESIMKELANVKLQLEAKDSAYKQLLHKLDHHEKTSHDLSTLLKTSDSQKVHYINESREAKVRVNELESTVTLISQNLSESEKVQKELAQAKTELETEVANLKESKQESLSKAEVLESAFSEEKLITRELKSRVSEMNETITDLKTRVTAYETEKEERIKITQELENALLDKTTCISSLEMGLKEANELYTSSKKSASDAVDELEKMKEEKEAMEKKNSDQTNSITLLEKEVKELGSTNEGLKFELEKIKEKENDLQIEIALLKFELHKGRSKLAASEAAEARLQGEKSALYTALQDMGLEVEEAKKENKVLKKAMKLSDNNKNNSVDNPEGSHDESNVETEKVNEERIVKVENNPSCEALEYTKKELEVAMSRIAEFRTRAEQAISRAEAAEKAKAVMEEKIKRFKEHKERKKAALEALREESVSREIDRARISVEYDKSDKIYQPLGKVLNMKF